MKRRVTKRSDATPKRRRVGDLPQAETRQNRGIRSYHRPNSQTHHKVDESAFSHNSSTSSGSNGISTTNETEHGESAIASQVAQVSSTLEATSLALELSIPDERPAHDDTPEHIYRLRGIPLGATESDLSRILKNHYADPAADIKINSLAIDAHGRSQVATLSFGSPVARLPPGTSHNLHVSIGSSSRSQSTWALDDNFYGMTVLHCPPPEEHTVDIIAISGLGSHAYGSFKERGGKYMWLVDSLSNDVPSARIAVYGYASGLEDSSSFQNLSDLGSSFLRAIQVLHGGDSPKRPIIFVAHSLGGLIMKESIVQLSRSKVDRNGDIMRCIYGALFFGVPNDGMDIESFIRVVDNGPNRSLIESLGQNNSQILKILQNDFREAFNFRNSSEIHCFFETQKSKTLEKNSNGKYVMIGEPKVLVNTTSATHCRDWETSHDHMTPLSRDHTSLVKFGPHEDDYYTVLDVLQEMVRKTAHYQEQRGISLGASGGESLQNSTSKEQKRVLLDSLRFDQLDARHQNIKKAHGKTCNWLLEKPEYHDWLNPSKLTIHHGFLWIKGKPGAGKSTLMKFALDATRKSRDKIAISFFFNARGEELEKSTIGMYRSLLFQLLMRLPKLQMVFSSLDYALWDGDLQQWSVETLKALFEDAVMNLGSSKLVCFVDALDECNDSQVRDMVSFFEQVSDQTTLKNIDFRICFASRYYPHITVKRGVNLELDKQDEHDQDIASYLESELRIGHDLLAEKIRSDLKEKASGVFMWVVLVVGILQEEFDHGHIHQLQSKLQEIPADLHELFRNIMTRDYRNMTGLILCIQWILFARRPLKPEELYFAILSGTDITAVCKWKRSKSNQELIRKFILSCSKGLAEITKTSKPTVQFIHESVRDFLLKEDGLQSVWTEPRENIRGTSQDRLKRCCFEYMDIASGHLAVEGRASEQASRSRKTVEKEFPFLEYAVHNILIHADAAEADDVSQESFLQTFQLIDWIKHYNLFERHKVRRYTLEASLLYILAENNLLNLIQIQPGNLSCFAVEQERYGAPILAALAVAGHSAVYALLTLEARTESSASPFHKLCQQYLQEGHKAGLGRKLEYIPDKGLLGFLIDCKQTLLVRCALTSRKANADEKVAGTYGNTLLSHAVNNDCHDIVRLLLDRSAPIGAANKHGHTPLYIAAWRGHEAIMRLLLDRGAPIGAANKHGHTPLYVAAWRRHEAIVRLLLDRGAPIDAADRYGDTPLHEAAGFGHEAIVRLLLDRGAQINAANGHGSTPLHKAAHTGHEAIVRLLLDRGAQINAADRDGDTPLHEAARFGHEAIVRLLLDRGAQIEVTNERGITPLSAAAAASSMYGTDKMVRLLLERGALIEATDDNGCTPFLHAAQNGAPSVVKLFLDKGSQVEREDNSGRTAISCAVARCELPARRLGEKMEVLQLLFDNGLQIETVDSKGRSPLSYAAESSDAEVVQWLLDHGAQVERSDNTGRTPLSYAALRHSSRILGLLIKQGARLEVSDKQGLTALLHAASQCKTTNIKVLLHRGANIGTHDKAGYTALDHAMVYLKTAHLIGDEMSAVKLLLDNGAKSRLIDDVQRKRLMDTPNPKSKKFGRLLEEILDSYPSSLS